MPATNPGKGNTFYDIPLQYTPVTGYIISYHIYTYLLCSIWQLALGSVMAQFMLRQMKKKYVKEKKEEEKAFKKHNNVY